MPLTARRLIWAGPLFTTLGLGAAGAWADEVVLVPNSTVKAAGGQVRGTIARETPSEVVIGSQSIPLDQIASITYDQLPPSFPLAELREKNGSLVEAADLYQKAATEATRPVIAQTAQFRRARILAQLGDADPARAAEAIKDLEDFTQKNKASRHLVPALESLARLSMHRGDHDRAARALAEMARVPWAAERASVLQARVLAAKGQYDQAIAAADRVLAAAKAGTPARREATMARAEALAGQKKFAEAQTAVREVIRAASPEDTETLAAAYNTLGDCLRAAGKPKDALFAYLHTDILFNADKDEHARALAQVARLWRELKQKDRADEALARLKQDYPQSRWVAEASK